MMQTPVRPGAAAFVSLATLFLPGASAAEFPLTDDGQGNLTFDLAKHQQIASLDVVVFEGLMLPAGRLVDLELRRVIVSSVDAPVYVDGGPDESWTIGDNVTLWSGHVRGSETSAAYLAFSPFGSRGFIWEPGQLVSLGAMPGSQGWSDSYSRFFEGDPVGHDATGIVDCASDGLLAPTGGVSPLPKKPGTQLGSAVVPIYECRVAIETDYQYFQVFNDLEAATVYMTTLFGAVSDRYREQVGTILTLGYLGMYSNSNDPWSTSDSGSPDCFAVLEEFRSAWENGNAPVASDLYQRVTGSPVGCGLGYLDVLCDQDYGFSLTVGWGGNPFPITVNPNNRDFMVMAHELGHNFGSPHTHDFNPPIDGCAFGSHTNQGTLMSYCHTCPGGYSNITTYFHPQVVSLMRSEVQSSCLPFFEGVAGQTDLGFGLAGSGGTPDLTVDYVNGPDDISFDVTSAPANQGGILAISPNQLLAPLFGGTFVPDVDVVLPLFSNGVGNASLAGPISGVSFPAGAFFYSQAWFNDPSGPVGVAASNAIEFELILP